MRRRFINIIAISLILLALVLTAFPGQRTLAAEGSEGETQNIEEAVVGADGLPNPFSYGEDELFVIVPVCGGSGCVDISMTHKYIQMYKTLRTANQLWKIRKTDSGYYMFESPYENRVLSVPQNSGTASSGVKLVSDINLGTTNQLWKIEPAGDGSYYIRSRMNPDFVWDIVGGSTTNATRIQLYKINFSPAQRFRFVHVSTVEPESAWGATRHDCNISNADSWDGGFDNSFYYNNKNAVVYEIGTARQLAGLAQLVRDGVCDFRGRTIILTRDINLCGIEWRRIGNGDRPFRGSFNGGGHAITGLSITTNSSEDGFFGFVNGGCITNFAIKGSVSGDFNTGGVVGKIDSGHIVNVYSEVSLSRATDDNQGGITGRCGTDAYIEHCTQNARLNSGDSDPDRGGIAGFQQGVIRYCVNKGSVDCDWNYLGGISGECVGGKIEYCANYGQVSGGSDTEFAGGITGRVRSDGYIFACVNYGYVYSSDDDYIGGIAGKREEDGKVLCSINYGDVRGDDRVGGITGDGWCRYCLNVGSVYGDDYCGALSGSASSLNGCRAIEFSAGEISGDSSYGNTGAVWAKAADIIGGKTCYELNREDKALDLGGYGPGWTEVFYQNIGGDAFPSFSGQKVYLKDGKYVNDNNEVRVDYDREYGEVTVTGPDASGNVNLSAQPADGCDFDGFEVSRSYVGRASVQGTPHDFPLLETQEYTDPQLILSADIGSYSVKALFSYHDNTPDDLKVSVKLEIECSDDTDGWNSTTVPVYLVDSTGEKHLWEVAKDSLDGEGKKVDHTFDLGAASPVSVEAYPDFGGGFTFHDLGLKARMWINNSETAIESSEVMIRSYPFTSSKYGNDYMNITFSDSGSSRVGIMNSEGKLEEKGKYTTCSSAWEAAVGIGKGAVIILDGVWLPDSRFELSDGNVTIDLNGYPIIRSSKKTSNNGEVFEVGSGATLNIKDSTPERKSCSAFSGGSIQGGRSDNSGGLIEVAGTFNMTGGALYNGGTTETGGAIRVKGGTVNLDGTLISDSWADKAWFTENNGGAISITDSGKVTLKDCVIRNCKAHEKGGAIFTNKDSTLTLENTDILLCTANDEYAGAIYEDTGSVTYKGGRVDSCRSIEDEAGAIFQNNGTLYCRNITFSGNNADDSAGAIYVNTDDQTWLIGCTFTGNYCGDYGGAIYLDDNYLYMYDCSLTGNSSGKGGGAIYLNDTGSIDIGGVMVIESNDGKESLDNLVLEKGANLYDAGLEEGSRVHLRSDKDGEVRIGQDDNTYAISKYQVEKFLISDYSGGLVIKDAAPRNTELSASMFTSGHIAIIAGAAALLIFIVIAVIFFVNKKKGARS